MNALYEMNVSFCAMEKVARVITAKGAELLALHHEHRDLCRLDTIDKAGELFGRIAAVKEELDNARKAAKILAEKHAAKYGNVALSA